MRQLFLVAFTLTLVSFVPRIARAGCEMDSQCKRDRVCEAGVCVAPPPAAPAPQAPTTCGADTDCTGDQICEQGVCHAPASTPAAPATTQAPVTPAPSVPTPAPTAAAPAVVAPPPPSSRESPAPAEMPPVLVKQFGVTGFLAPSVGPAPFVGLQADVSMAAPGPRSALLGGNVGFGFHKVPMGDLDISVKSMHFGAWIGFQAKVSSMTTYRVKAGGLSIKDNMDQFGGGGFLGGESKFGKLLFGLDLWLTKSADVLLRVGFEL